MRGLSALMTFAAVSAGILSPCAFSQERAGAYPSRPVTLILPFTSGGPTDIEARLYGGKMAALLGQQFLVDYKPGAGATIGAGFVAKSKPDGYTLLAVTGAFTTFPGLIKDLPFDTIRDFAPISLMGESTMVFMTRASLPAKNIAEYIAYARANPGKVTFGTAGPGSITHLSGEWIHGVTNTKVTYVAYKATPPQIVDMLGDRLDIIEAGIVTALPLIKSGKLGALAVSTKRRSKLLPELPTVAEQGIPGFDVSLWMGFSAPAGTPAAIITRLSEEFSKVAKDRDVIAQLEAGGGVPVGSTPAQFREFVVSETDRWRKLVQERGIVLTE